MTANELQAQLCALGCPQDAAFLARFFKTGPGEYGEGDVFIGVRVPTIRAVAKRFRDMALPEVQRLLRSEVHEERLAALVILVLQAARADTGTRKTIYRLYLANTRYVNNWDLVDLSAPRLVGAYLENRSRRPLDRLARSSWLWDRRISILATSYFIRMGDHGDTLRIAEALLGDEEDLIHKAVGWMLREVGKRDLATLERFLDRHHRAMPRTMLRYAIEKLPEPTRRAYLETGPRPRRAGRSPRGRRR
jgi:3-methyladenine DNA glycosylase AlkD